MKLLSIKSLQRSYSNRQLLLFLLQLCFAVACHAQVPDSIAAQFILEGDTTRPSAIPTPPDSIAAAQRAMKMDSLIAAAKAMPTDSAETKPKKRGFVKRFFNDGFPNPKKAALLSLVFPGGGQLYNRRYIKAPIVIGGIGYSAYLISVNTKRFKQFRKAHLYRVDGDPDTIDEFTDVDGNEAWSDSDLRRWRDIFQKDKELAYVATIAIFTLSAVEAFVDAHLRTFDVDEDLGVRFKPQFEWLSSTGLASMGISIVVDLDRKKLEQPKVFYQPIEK